MVNELMVELSRLQFAATSMYHFIFVPLTLGISWLVFIMELCYVATGRVIYRDMAKFWGKLFAINFAIGVATGITLEFEFGTNWSNYSHYVGDIFGAPLALEGLMAFFLESTFIGLMFTGWKRFGKKTHLLITFLTALGSNLSAMWILIANGWMQYPEFAQFSPERMRMEMIDFWGLVFSEVAQTKFLHTVIAGYTTAGFFVIAVSAILMLRRKSLQFAKRSMTIGIVFSLCAMGGSGLTGDMSALLVTEHQPAKLAAMEAEYETQTPPASWSIMALPNEDEMENYFSIRVPALLGLIATHSLDQEVQGLRDIVAQNEIRIRSGLLAYRALTQMRAGDTSEDLMVTFKQHQDDLGYGLLLVEHAQDPLNPTEEEIKTAARHSVPPVFINYYAFRIMIGIVGLLGLLALGAAFFLWYKRDLHTREKLLKVLAFSLPLPFIACEAGWVVAEFGRQPWAIQDVLPTFLATSTLSPWDVGLSLICFVGIYTIFLLIEVKMMINAIKKGPTLTDPEPDGKGYPPLPPAPKPEAKVEDKPADAVAPAAAAAEAAPAADAPAADAKAAAEPAPAEAAKDETVAEAKVEATEPEPEAKPAAETAEPAADAAAPAADAAEVAPAEPKVDAKTVEVPSAETLAEVKSEPAAEADAKAEVAEAAEAKTEATEPAKA